MSKSLAGTTPPSRNSMFRFSNRMLSKECDFKRNPFLRDLKLLCIVQCGPDMPIQLTDIPTKLAGLGISIKNTMFVDSGSSYSRNTHIECMCKLSKSIQVKNFLAPVAPTHTSSSAAGFCPTLVDAMKIRIDAGARRLVVFTHTKSIDDILFAFDKEVEMKVWNSRKEFENSGNILVVDYASANSKICMI